MACNFGEKSSKFHRRKDHYAELFGYVRKKQYLCTLKTTRNYLKPAQHTGSHLIEEVHDTLYNIDSAYE